MERKVHKTKLLLYPILIRFLMDFGEAENSKYNIFSICCFICGDNKTRNFRLQLLKILTRSNSNNEWLTVNN